MAGSRQAVAKQGKDQDGGAGQINISIILAGGVSLGSFEAGAITELFYALDYLNRQPGGQQFKIDVITGGSAGSLTAALAARIMIHDYERSRGLLHETWVKTVDISALSQGERPRGALLSSALPKKLAEDLIYTNTRIPFDTRGKASWAPEVLQIGFSLANMVGYDESIPFITDSIGGTQDPSGFCSTHFADFAYFTIDPAHVNDPATWKQLALAAIASGSFPIIFPPMSLLRTPDEYEDADADSKRTLPGEIPFVDGGMFNNEPIREAIRLAKKQDGDDPQKLRDRIFILIDPTANKTRRRPQNLEELSLISYGQRLAEMAYTQAQAQDLARALEVNRAIQWRDSLVKELKPLIDALPTAQLDEPAAGIDKLNHAIQAERVARDDKPAVTKATVEAQVNKQMAQISAYHADMFEQPEKTRESRAEAAHDDLLKKVIAAINSAADLEGKVGINLNRISAEQDQTVGDDFMAFSGFFKEDWREYDYLLGREMAFQCLPRILGVDAYPPEFPPLPGQTEPYINRSLISGDPKKLSIGDADRDKRERFLDLVVQRTNALFDRTTFSKNWLLNLLASLAARAAVGLGMRGWLKL